MWHRRAAALVLWFFGSALATRPVLGQAATGRIRLRFDTTEATAVLVIVEAHRSGRPITDADWQRLFSTEGYLRLKARETSMGRSFADSEFAAFVLSDTLGARAPALRRTLADWSRADVGAAGNRALAYLPPPARLQATVYLVIKPRSNSFVFETASNPAIFLYVDPEVTRPKLENTIAHELHHIGVASVQPLADSLQSGLPDSTRLAATWMGAFAEGFAMLAAAGGPGVHPHAASPPAERARWDHDVANFNPDLQTLERFFLDVIGRRLATPDTVQAVAASFYGVQGPWYTVGWKMAVVIEQRFGRASLIQCMLDPRLLLTRYNQAAAEINRAHPGSLALWSNPLLAALGVRP